MASPFNNNDCAKNSTLSCCWCFELNNSEIPSSNFWKLSKIKNGKRDLFAMKKPITTIKNKDINEVIILKVKNVLNLIFESTSVIINVLNCKPVNINMGLMILNVNVKYPSVSIDEYFAIKEI